MRMSTLCTYSKKSAVCTFIFMEDWNISVNESKECKLSVQRYCANHDFVCPMNEILKKTLAIGYVAMHKISFTICIVVAI